MGDPNELVHMDMQELEEFYNKMLGPGNKTQAKALAKKRNRVNSDLHDLFLSGENPELMDQLQEEYEETLRGLRRIRNNKKNDDAWAEKVNMTEEVLNGIQVYRGLQELSSRVYEDLMDLREEMEEMPNFTAAERKRIKSIEKKRTDKMIKGIEEVRLELIGTINDLANDKIEKITDILFDDINEYLM
jgi:hypothetical protein